MKVLLTSELKGGNPLIDGFYHRMCKFVDIQASINEFWSTDSSNHYDVIHLQWPEQLFKWKKVNRDDILRLEQRLKYWKDNGSRLVITRHNILPHKLNSLYQEIYKLIYTYVDAVIHYSYASIDNFKSMYTNTLDNPSLVHEVIYHPMYSDILNDCTQQEARKTLQLDENKNIILVFGRIRHKKERNLIKSAFKRLDVENKFLIVPRWYRHPKKKQFFDWVLFQFKRFIYSLKTDRMLGYRLVPEEDIQYYMNAADVVFIPRSEVLNSGVQILAYTFNKVVVGPATGSIGELLEYSNNPAFKVDDFEDAALKLKKGIELSKQKVENYSFAQKNMNWELVIDKHLQLYTKLQNEK
ncbi:hypothetical protein PGH07_01385 [Sulfurovum sp. zt1-1]|uniref:Glycosyl transferase family 1 domain-containing protein n=1 Tax=Sulfurovum zhangzhouensis TaxID=3019067 RepID=A0ABT7QVG3_9BACT|nr:hypothetical protein [Sulfurovum zhangzhouensis]MDM5270825.1 hypothetical protein [Sulfurovum zhangzhouensis]